MTSFRQIAEKMDPVKPPVRLRGSVPAHTLGIMDQAEKGLWSIHRWLPTEEHTISLRKIIERHKPSAGTTHRVLFYNAWLVNVLFEKSGSPDLQGRARDIGHEISGYYDIAGLCEVWDKEQLKRIRDQLSSFDDATGPAGKGTDQSAGLVTFVRPKKDERRINYDRALTSDHRNTQSALRELIFEERGSRTRDADAWARKGALRTVVDVGVGKIDFYTTHLFSGGGLLGKPTKEERLNIQLSQLRELIKFVRSTHRQEHIAIIAGDFNIQADDQDAYPTLVRELAQIGLRDIWPTRGGKHGSTFLTESHPAERCRLDATQERSKLYCDDYARTVRDDYDRIDYLFMEDPSPAHRFNLDITRVHRRPFFRDLTGSGRTDLFMIGEKPNYLSDHLGLEFDLIASRRVD